MKNKNNIHGVMNDFIEVVSWYLKQSEWTYLYYNSTFNYYFAAKVGPEYYLYSAELIHTKIK